MTFTEIIWLPAISPSIVLMGTLLLLALATSATWRLRHRIHRLASVGLLGARSIAIILLALILLGPAQLIPTPPTSTKPPLTVLLDLSQSMLTTDMQGQSRINHTRDHWLTPDTLARAYELFDLQMFGFHENTLLIDDASQLENIDQLATGRNTPLIATLVDLLKQGKTFRDPTTLKAHAGVIVLSDGRDSDALPDISRNNLTNDTPLPIHTHTIGGPTLGQDITLIALPSQEYLLAGEPGELIVNLHHVGLAGQVARVHVRQTSNDKEENFNNNDPPSTREVELQPPVNDLDHVAQITLPIQEDQPGLYHYTVDVEPFSGEIDLSNNTQSVFVHITDRRLRVLMLDGEPFWDSKFLAQSLRRDDRVELVQITQITETRRERIVTRAGELDPTSATLPTTLDEWSQYDVVILGRAIERLLDEQNAAALKQYVSVRGGHLIFARGQAYTNDTPENHPIRQTLALLEPVTWSNQSVSDRLLLPTNEGLASPLFSTHRSDNSTPPNNAFTQLPRLSADPSAQQTKIGATALATLTTSTDRNDPSHPNNQFNPVAIATMKFGRGDVALIAVEGLWQWRLLPPSRADDRAAYDTLWSTLVRWLAMGGDFKPGEEVSLRLSRSTAQLGDSITADIAYKRPPPPDALPQLRVTQPDNSTVRLTPQPIESSTSTSTRYRVTYTPPQIGEYAFELDISTIDPDTPTLTDRLSVYDVNLERLRSAANPELMRRLAQHTGGMTLTSSDANRWPDMIDRVYQSRQTQGTMLYLWDRWYVMAALLSWLGIEWIVRRKLGLL